MPAPFRLEAARKELRSASPSCAIAARSAPGMAGAKHLGHLIEVSKAAEEREVSFRALPHTGWPAKSDDGSDGAWPDRDRRLDTERTMAYGKLVCGETAKAHVEERLVSFRQTQTRRGRNLAGAQRLPKQRCDLRAAANLGREESPGKHVSQANSCEPLPSSVTSRTTSASSRNRASEDLQHFYFGCPQLSPADSSMTSFAVRCHTRGKSSQLCLPNVIPGDSSRPRFAAARSATLFFGNVEPARFLPRRAGFAEDTSLSTWARRSPQTSFRTLVRSVSTRYRDRASSRRSHRRSAGQPV